MSVTNKTNSITLANRLELLNALRGYLKNRGAELQEKIKLAHLHNQWFIPEFIQSAIDNLVNNYLDPKQLHEFVNNYELALFFKDKKNITTTGIVMAGNIPLVGFHDWLCCFLCGENTLIKVSSKDKILFEHLIHFLSDIEPRLANEIDFTNGIMPNCDRYLTMGSDISSDYFQKYFKDKNAIIRSNKTSVAILSGNETAKELSLLADDMMLFFGMGCRSVTQLYVPEKYDFKPLCEALKKYAYFLEIQKYKNNYDYQLTILLMTQTNYFTNDFILFIENESLFAPLSCIFYTYYKNTSEEKLNNILNTKIQCCLTHQDPQKKNAIRFGNAQKPYLKDFADDIDTIKFILNINKKSLTN